MKFTFDIPNSKLQRIADALPMEGYVYDSSLGTTDAVQKRQFFKKMTIEYWRSIIFNYERNEAIKLEPNDSAALQSQRFVGLDDISVTES